MTLNLATQPFVNRRRFYTLSGAAASVLLLTLAILLVIFTRNFRNEIGIRKQMTTMRQEIDRLDTEQQRIEEVLKRPESSDILDRNDFLNTLIREKAVSWTRIFMDLEKVMPDRVQTLALHPSPQIPGKESGKNASIVPASWDGPLVMELRLQIASENFDSMVKLVRNMEKSPFNKPVVGSTNPKAEASQAGAFPSSQGISFQKDSNNLYNMSLSVTYVQ
jgi:Tfp pilus assembly protein PilN